MRGVPASPSGANIMQTFLLLYAGFICGIAAALLLVSFADTQHKRTARVRARLYRR